MELCSEFLWKQQGPYFEWLFTLFRFLHKAREGNGIFQDYFLNSFLLTGQYLWLA